MNKKTASFLASLVLLVSFNASTSPSHAKCATLPQTMGVAVGESTSYAWSKSGVAYAWGRGDWGQRGDGSTTYSKNKPQRVKNVKYVNKIASYGAQALFLQRDGLVFTVGYNKDGQLGIGSKKNASTPQKIYSLTCVIDIAAGRVTSYALKSDGTVWGWGYNASEELNIGNSWPALKPQKIRGLSNIKSISAGEDNLFAIARNGFVYSLGYNFEGQLGTGSTAEPAKYPVKVNNIALNPKVISVARETVAATGTDGKLVIWGNPGQLFPEYQSVLTPREVPLSAKAKSVTLGWGLALVIDVNKSLWTFGSNRNGALGVNLEEDCYFSDGQDCGGYNAQTDSYFHVVYVPKIVLKKVASVAGGDNFSIAVQDNGTLWAWGSGGDGQLGNGYDYNTKKPSKVFNLNLNR